MGGDNRVLQRQWRGWSQETLAELSGLTVRTVQRVEAGDRVGPETRRALARAWGAPDINCLNTPTVFPTTEEIQAAEEKRLAELVRTRTLRHAQIILVVLALICFEE